MALDFANPLFWGGIVLLIIGAFLEFFMGAKRVFEAIMIIGVLAIVLWLVFSVVPNIG